MNLLDLVDPFKRHLGQYMASDHVDSDFAAYLADAIDALTAKWDRTYVVTLTSPKTYNVTPDIEIKDRRPIILMASIIYKKGSYDTTSFRDGDFAWDPDRGRMNPIEADAEELRGYLPQVRLGKAMTAPLRGFNNVYNPESYDWADILVYI